MYKIYIESIRLSDVTAQRLQAIQIAREWIEALENIRNTNWILYASDYGNCWNTRDYNISCVWNNGSTTDILSGSYIVYQNNTTQRWKLENKSTPSDFSDSLNNFEVFREDNFYTQSWSTNSMTPRFTREIQISYLDTDGNIWDSNDEKMQVKSIVQWKSRRTTPYTVELDLILTNWKNKD